jgi:hypothetical protein
MILSFSKKLKGLGNWDFNAPEKILTGVKKHTIRLDPNQRWKDGMKIHLAQGARTKFYKQFGEAEVAKVERLNIDMSKYPYWQSSKLIKPEMCYPFGKRYIQMTIEGSYITIERMEQLALEDGFDSLDQMLTYLGFSEQLKEHYIEGIVASLIWFKNVKEV